MMIKETGKTGYNTTKDRHWVGICVETFVEFIHLSFNVHLIHDSFFEFFEFVVVALSAVKENEANFNEGGFLG